MQVAPVLPASVPRAGGSAAHPVAATSAPTTARARVTACFETPVLARPDRLSRGSPTHMKPWYRGSSAAEIRRARVNMLS